MEERKLFSFFRPHPEATAVFGVFMILMALLVFLFNMITTAEHLLPKEPSDESYIIAYGAAFIFEAIENVLVIIFIFPAGKRMTQIMIARSFAPNQAVEFIVVVGLISMAVSVYLYDAYTSYMGLLAFGFNEVFAIIFGLMQVICFELLFHEGWWMVREGRAVAEKLYPKMEQQF